MPDQPSSNSPSGDSYSQPPYSTPFELAVEQRIVALEAKNALNLENEEANLLSGIKSGEGWLIGINGALLLATIFIAGIYNGQLTEMKKATIASTNAAFAACLSAKIANQTLQEIKVGGNDTHSMATNSVIQAAIVKRAEAALLVVADTEDGTFSYLPSQQPLAPLRISNIGKSSASRVSVRTAMEILPKGQEPSLKYGKNNSSRVDAGLIEPGTTMPPILIKWLKDGKATIISVAQASDVKAHKLVIYTFGRITYRDVFGDAHWTQFCIATASANGTIDSKRCSNYDNADSLKFDRFASPQDTKPWEDIVCKKP